MSDSTKAASRVSLWVGIAFLLVGSVLGLAYYLRYRPMWSPDVLGGAASFLTDPSTSAETLRNTALKGHDTLLASVAALDAAMFMLLIVCAAAGVVLIYVFTLLRRGSRNGAL